MELQNPAGQTPTNGGLVFPISSTDLDIEFTVANLNALLAFYGLPVPAVNISRLSRVKALRRFLGDRRRF